MASHVGNSVAVFDRAADGTIAQKPGMGGCISEFGLGPCVDGRGLESARTVALSPSGDSAYVASELSDAVAVFDRAADGTLTQKAGTAGCVSEIASPDCALGKALDAAESVAVSPDGKNAYVTSANDGDAVSVFDRGLTGLPSQSPSPPPPTPPSPPDTVAPLLSAFSLSPASFRAAGSGADFAARVGTTVSYRLSEAAAVRFTVERALPGRRGRTRRVRGRRVRGRCVKPKRSNRRAKRCTRNVTLRGAFTHQGKAGQNGFTFRGRLRNRKLAPGRYRLRAVATDPAGNKTRLQRSRFRIVRR
jgi:DNA-binding beta-propeller fold protein YncE